LPRTLGDAIEAFAKDDLAKETVGEAFPCNLYRLQAARME
jgi:hypothetical protein